jgi:putative flippase GtrA
VNFQDNLKQFIRFGIVGTFGATVDFGTYAIMTRFLGWATVYCVSLSGSVSRTNLMHFSSCTAPYYPVVAANMVSVLLAISANFFLNKYWTFRERTGNMAAQGIGYFIMSIIAWALNQLLTGVFASRLEIIHTTFGPYADVAAKILAVLVILFFNYGGSKFIIFGRRKAGAQEPAVNV